MSAWLGIEMKYGALYRLEWWMCFMRTGVCACSCVCVCVNVWDVYMCARQLQMSFLKDCLPCFPSWFLSMAWRLPSRPSCLASSFGDPLASLSSTGTADSYHQYPAPVKNLGCFSPLDCLFPSPLGARTTGGLAFDMDCCMSWVALDRLSLDFQQKTETYTINLPSRVPCDRGLENYGIKQWCLVQSTVSQVDLMRRENSIRQSGCSQAFYRRAQRVISWFHQNAFAFV